LYRERRGRQVSGIRQQEIRGLNPLRHNPCIAMKELDEIENRGEWGEHLVLLLQLPVQLFEWFRG